MANTPNINTITPGDIKHRQNAPAASALLYNVVGQGRAYNAMRKYAKEFFKSIKQK